MWQNAWRWCKRTFGPREGRLETSANSTFCWWKKQHARGPLSARWLTSWPTKAIYWYVTTKVCDAKLAMGTEHTSNSDFGAAILVCHGQTPPRSSPNSKTRKDSTSTRQQATRVTFSANLVNAAKRPANTTRKNSIIALHWVVRISSAHAVTLNFSLCLFPLSVKLISHTLINVAITPSLKLPKRVAKVSMFLRSCMVVAWRARGGKSPLLRTLVDPELHYGQISMTLTSEHAVISGLSAGSFVPVQSISRVDCAVPHGFGGVESVPRAAYISTPSKLVFSSSGIEVSSEHACDLWFLC